MYSTTENEENEQLSHLQRNIRQHLKSAVSVESSLRYENYPFIDT